MIGCLLAVASLSVLSAVAGIAGWLWLFSGSRDDGPL